MNCDDSNACTGDFCDTQVGCLHFDISSSCDDANDCTDDFCDAVLGCLNSNHERACSDGNACTTGDTCLGGVCTGTDTSVLDCDDANPCTDDSCDAFAGCLHQNNSAPCDDGLFCTGTEQCAQGTCVSSGDPCPGQFCDEDGNACASIAFTAPVNLALFNTPTISIEGTATGNPISVIVNGRAATLANGGWALPGFALREGTNWLSALATYANGGVAAASIQVVRDSTAPAVVISSPADGSKVFVPSITVTGAINDSILAVRNDTPPHCEVNGKAVPISGNAFVASNVPLTPGMNTITARVTDLAGNVGTKSIQIRYDAKTTQRIEVASGDNQSAIAGQALATPLVARLIDKGGQPAANQPVIFRVTQNSGGFADGTRLAMSYTNANGEAQMQFILGSRAGDGCNRIEATSVGFAGRAVFVATSLAGPAAKINVSMGFHQRGMVNSLLPEALAAIVTDTGGNPLIGLPVTYKVVSGGGRFAENNSDTLVINTDLNGRTATTLILGPNEGIENNVVEAKPDNLKALPAVFVASGWVPGDPQDTRLAGVVLDNAGAPLEGVMIYISGTGQSTKTDSQGQFLLNNIPVGFVRIVVIGETTPRPGKWPLIQYDLVTIAGRENSFGMPVYLLPVVENAPVAGGDDEVVLTLENVPGFQMRVLPHSTTFPCPGSLCAPWECVNGLCPRGVVTVTQVHSDKVPMTPSDGLQPTLILTIQPPNVHFDPPAPICYPNSDRLRPGEVQGMYSFDHELGRFVSIGTGTVSEDGSVICSDPGFGIIKGGWHCAGPSNPQGFAQPPRVSINGKEVPDPICMSVQDQVTLVARGEPQPGGVPAFEWTFGGPIWVVSGGLFNSEYITVERLADGPASVSVSYRCESGQADTATTNLVDVEFQTRSGEPLPSPFMLGVSGSTIDRTQHLRAIVNPAQEAERISIEAGPLLQMSRQTTHGGTIDFDLTARSILAASESPGDRHIKAMCGDGSAFVHPITVIVPRRISKPYSTEGSGPQPCANVALTAASQPPISVTPAFVALRTLYYRDLTLTVLDQFDEPLRDPYAGSPISEGGVAINVTLSSQGTYVDRVGLQAFPGDGGFACGPGDGVVPEGSPCIEQWFRAPCSPCPEESVGGADVEVDGIPLQSGTGVRRKRCENGVLVIELIEP